MEYYAEYKEYKAKAEQINTRHFCVAADAEMSPSGVLVINVNYYWQVVNLSKAYPKYRFDCF